jgi:mannan endo-1,4-beta-mannosidase
MVMRFFLLTLIIINCATFYAQVQPSLLSVNGKFLYDNCGEKIILKGVNMGNVWATNWGIPEFAQIQQTGSNTVRICLQRTYVSYASGSAQTLSTTGTLLDPILAECIAQKMIPIIELHDFTSPNPSATATQFLPLATAFWTRPDILSVLKKYQNYLILNIANEPEHWDMTELEYYNANKTAILTLRNASLDCPIMIDGVGWGQDYWFFINHGANLLNDDPLHKLVYSIHSYWENITDADMLSRFQAMNNANLPFVFGEMSKSNGTVAATINYSYFMQLCSTYDIGFIAWWWGFYNTGSNNVLSMSPTGTYAGLTSFGLDIAVSDSNSIQNTSIRPYSLLNAIACNNVALENVSKNDFEIFPNPTTDFVQIISQSEIKAVEIFSTTGTLIYKKEVKSHTQTLDISSFAIGMYIISIENNNGEMVQKRITKE